MELKKLQCNSCGAAMEILPGIDRIKCSYCGMSYLMERKDNDSNKQMENNGNGDNPQEVLLVPDEENTIGFNIENMSYFPKVNITFGGSILGAYYEHKLDKIFEDIEKKIHFFAALAYLTQENYKLEIGSFCINPVMLYSTNEKGEDLKEPDKTYDSHHAFGNYSIMVKPQYGKEQYTKKENDNKNKEISKRIDEFIKKNNIEFEDKTKITPYVEEKFNRRAPFGLEIKGKNYWTSKYTDRRLFVNMNYDNAKKLLSNDDIEKLDKVGKQECIKDIGSIVNNELSKEAKIQLDERKHSFVLIHFGSNNISIENPRNKEIMNADKGVKIWERQLFTKMEYKNYGMSNIDNVDIMTFLAAQVINYVYHLENENKDVNWKITDINYNGINLSIKLFPTVKTVGVYNSWV